MVIKWPRKKKILFLCALAVLFFMQLAFFKTAYGQTAIEIYPSNIIRNGSTTISVEFDFSGKPGIPFANYHQGIKPNATVNFPYCFGGGAINTNLNGVFPLTLSGFSSFFTSGSSLCQNSGIYYYVWEGEPAESEDFFYYARFSYNSATRIITFFTNPNPNPPSNNTPSISETEYIRILQPTPYGTTTATTTVAQVYFSIPFSFDFRPETIRYYRIFDAVTGEIEYEYEIEVPENANESLTVTEILILQPGSKIMQATYLNALDRTVYGDIAETFFNVATNTYLQVTGLETPRSNPSNLSQITPECESVFDVACQLQKAFVFLFVPSETVLDRFAGSWQTIRTKPPFGYITSVIDQLKGFDQNATPAFTWPQLPFIDTIFNVFRDGLGLLLWGVYAVYFYRERLVKIEI